MLKTWEFGFKHNQLTNASFVVHPPTFAGANSLGVRMWMHQKLAEKKEGTPSDQLISKFKNIKNMILGLSETHELMHHLFCYLLRFYFTSLRIWMHQNSAQKFSTAFY